MTQTASATPTVPNRPAQGTSALVLVSHSRPLAEAVAALARQMTGDAVDIVCAAGAGDNGETLGTDAVAIAQAIESVDRPAGVVVLMDLGSALLSADLALELIPPEVRVNVRLTGCAFVEGAVAAAASASAGANAETIIREAANALMPKAAHLGEDTDGTAVLQASGDQPYDASGEATIPDPNGLHARPAARLVALAGTFDAEIFISDITRGAGPVQASSLVALSTLGSRGNDRLQVSARGPQANDAVKAMLQLIGGLTGADEISAPAVAPGSGVAQTSSRAVPVAPGVAFGPAVYFERTIPQVPTWKTEDTAAEIARLKRALSGARKSIGASSAGRTGSDIFVVQIALLRDPALVQRAEMLIASDHCNAAAAWQRAVTEAAEVYAQLDDPYLKAREADVHDAGRTVLRFLLGSEQAQLPKGAPCILIADDLAPSEAAQLDPAQFLGVIDRRGGPTSHAAILLRAAGIPSVAGAASLVPVEGARMAGLDGATGEVWVDPDAATQERVEQRRAAWRAARKAAAQDASGKVATRDGREIELWANVAGIADARAARQAGAVGIGLLRTEMLFLDRSEAPGEDEQVETLRGIFDIFVGYPIVVRTLDAGGDKQLPYLAMESEANPYLGVRGVRLCLERSELFETQFRAILRAGQGHDVRIMIPMIAEAPEIEQTRVVLDRAHQALVKAKVPHLWPVPLGTMIEVPAAALLAERLAAQTDFFSIGTNDLTQYVLAAERGHPHLGRYADAAHPAVLRMVQEVVEAGKTAGRPVSVCGEAAADPMTAALLVGLGVTRLSMGAASLGGIRQAMRKFSFAALEAAAHDALSKADAAGARVGLQSLI